MLEATGTMTRVCVPVAFRFSVRYFLISQATKPKDGHKKRPGLTKSDYKVRTGQPNKLCASREAQRHRVDDLLLAELEQPGERVRTHSGPAEFPGPRSAPMLRPQYIRALLGRGQKL